MIHDVKTSSAQDQDVRKLGSLAKYTEDSHASGYWFYNGLRIQADIETHRFVLGFASHTFVPGSLALDVAAGEIGRASCRVRV